MENTIREKMIQLSEKEYGDFQARAVPGIPRESILGIRVPVLRKLAAEILKSGEYSSFIRELPHAYYDEYMLHSIILSSIRDFSVCLEQVEIFLPYVDNWAVCDTLSPKVFKKHRRELLEKIRSWASSEKVYTCRFGIDMLMSHFLDEDFSEELPEIPAGIHSEEYYVNMMCAWYFATALAKQWEAVIPYIEERRLTDTVHRMTIRKACESFRITEEQKTYLKSLK